MSKFVCMDKFVLSTFSISCVIKDLGWCQSMELYFVVDIYQPDCVTFSSKIMHNNIQPKMRQSWNPPLNNDILLQIHFAN